jgi:hypothetical protein
MNVEFSKEDLQLLEMVLLKEEGETRVEIHHCFDFNYKDFLKKREKQVGDILVQVRNSLARIK